MLTTSNSFSIWSPTMDEIEAFRLLTFADRVEIDQPNDYNAVRA